MVRKKLAMAILALSALQADLASAVGLGSLSVKSALNQPLNAEIRLLDTGDLDPTQIKVQLAAPEDFERAGVDRGFFLGNLKFAVDMNGQGGGTIRITTRDPVTEPYLNFVVEARWPSGRLLREFAVLLDPPTFSGGAAQAAPRPALPAPSQQIEPPKVSSENAPDTADRLESNTLPESANPGEHRVQVGETLSQIAGRYRPATDVTTQQTMLAIQRANPEAFIENNINRIRAGAILRIPNAEAARSVAAGEAGQLIAEQSHAWRSGAGAAAGEPASGPQLDASQPQSDAQGGYQEKERLTIATPGNSDKSSVGEGSGKGSKGLEALRNQLSASQESLDSAKRDNKELQSRLDDMERQVATLQRLIALKDDQLAAVQAKAADQGKAPAVAPTPAAKAAEPLAAQTPAVAAPAPAPAVQPKPKPIVQKVPQPAPEPTLLNQLTSNPLYLGGGLAALLLGIGGAVMAKRRREQAEEDSAYEALDLGDYTAEAPSSEAGIDLDNALVSDEAIVDGRTVAEAPIAAAESEKKAVRSETGDAIAEADIYVAYGRYQQAVDLLAGAIDAEPNRSDLRVKLLEVLLEMRNREAFRQQFMALQSLDDANAVVLVKEMLSSVDGVSDWLNDLPTSSPAASAGLALGAAAAAVQMSEARASIEAAPDDALDIGDLDLDLDLGDDVLESPAAPVAEELAPVVAESLDDLELDLDLDLDADEGALDLGLDLDSDAVSLAAETAPALESAAEMDLESELDQFAADSLPDMDAGAAVTAEEDELELDLDSDELELDLNEDDLDFALKAMNGGDAVAEPGLGGEMDLAGELDAAFVESAADLASEPEPEFAQVANLDDDLQEFDLSLASDEFAAATVTAEERQALEADLGDLADLDDLDFGGGELVAGAATFAEPAVSPAAESAISLDLEDFAEPAFAELEPAPVEAAPAAAAAGDDFDFLADTDEVATKLDLARAYIDMGDTDGARDILDEVMQEGSDVQKREASELLGRMV